VTIYVECDGGSTTEITEHSMLPIHDGPTAALLVQEAFLRTCRALGVVEQQAPAPDPPPEPEKKADEKG
jgi:hypothetical protein